MNNKLQTINCKGEIIDFSTPLVMGILNVTPDSFFDGGVYNSKDKIISQLDKMLHEGADVIDVGGYSSRPGAKHISEKEELDRVLNTLEIIRNHNTECILSVDTFRAEVAKQAVEKFNADIINDISAGDMDDKMFETMAKLNVPYIIMHMKGTPDSMQKDVYYDNDIVNEIIDYLADKKYKLNLLGVNDIIIDPGYGFGKTLNNNFEILNRQKEFEILDLPILTGISRKSMIYNALNVTPQDALNGTTALNMVALNNSASILRVHDVKEAVECVKLYEKLKGK